jgi:hypothetical protein
MPSDHDIAFPRLSFAAGDVRSGSVKRCASAVGEGAMAVSFVHASLETASPAKDVSPSTQ